MQTSTANADISALFKAGLLGRNLCLDNGKLVHNMKELVPEAGLLLGEDEIA